METKYIYKYSIENGKNKIITNRIVKEKFRYEESDNYVEIIKNKTKNGKISKIKTTVNLVYIYGSTKYKEDNKTYQRNIFWSFIEDDDKAINFFKKALDERINIKSKELAMIESSLHKIINIRKSLELKEEIDFIEKIEEYIYTNYPDYKIIYKGNNGVLIKKDDDELYIEYEYIKCMLK